jgi:hypothetical protein
MWLNADISGGPGNRIEVTEERIFGENGRLSSASQQLKGQSGINSWKLENTAAGWVLLSDIGSQRSKKQIAPPPDNLLSDCRMYREIRSSAMRVGNKWRDTVIEMMSGRPVVATTVCTAVDTSLKLWRFETTDDFSGRTERCVFGSDGKTVERSIEGLYIAKRRGSPPAVSRQSAQFSAPSSAPADAASVTELFAVTAKGACPKDLAIAAVLTDSALSLDSSVQFLYRKQGTSWVLSKIPAACPRRKGTPEDKALGKWLAPGPTIQSDHPKITSLARELVGKETDPCAIIGRFNHYVYSHVEKRNDATLSNALETLNSGFGDCGEHAALLAALLRAAGIPSRVALGLLFIDAKKAYFYHAQVMAYASGKWLFTDPTWDIFPASGRFVPLIIDDTGTDAMLIARLIGRIRIEYVKRESD